MGVFGLKLKISIITKLIGFSISVRSSDEFGAILLSDLGLGIVLC